MSVGFPSGDGHSSGAESASETASSTGRQFSDEEEVMIQCHFMNAITGDKYVTKALNYGDNQISVGYLFSLVKQKLGSGEFKLQVGGKVWSELDVYGKVFRHQVVKDAVAASKSREISFQVIRVTTPEEPHAKRRCIRDQPE